MRPHKPVPSVRRFLASHAVDLGLSALALGDVVAFGYPSLWPDGVLALSAAVALLVRRRWPVAVFVLALTAVLFTDNVFSALVGLLTLAEFRRSRSLLAVSALAYAVFANVPKIDGFSEVRTAGEFVVAVGYSLAAAGAALVGGRLVRTRKHLIRRMEELHASERERRELHARAVLAGERVRLAREMHDVVSHQVSLIAVRAGALQVSAGSPDTTEAARTIRKLSAATLDELRQMVVLLRAPGGSHVEQSPQSTQERLDELIALSGLDARLEGEVPGDAGAAVRHAAFRTVQEALTNIRKHAPGSTVRVSLDRSGTELAVTVVNTAARRPRPVLPGSGLGLLGLRERAEDLGGTLEYGPTPDGGYRVRARFPELSL